MAKAPCASRPGPCPCTVTLPLGTGAAALHHRRTQRPRKCEVLGKQVPRTDKETPRLRAGSRAQRKCAHFLIDEVSGHLDLRRGPGW